MDDPVLTAIVSALAGGAVAELTAGSRAAFKALVRLVRRKVAEHPDAENALLRAQQEPSDERRLAELHAMLATAVLNDRAFAAELHRLWNEVRAGQGCGRHQPDQQHHLGLGERAGCAGPRHPRRRASRCQRHHP